MSIITDGQDSHSFYSRSSKCLNMLQRPRMYRKAVTPQNMQLRQMQLTELQFKAMLHKADMDEMWEMTENAPESNPLLI